MSLGNERWFHYTVITYFQCDSLQKKVESPRILLGRYMNNATNWYSVISTPTNQRSYTNMYTQNTPRPTQPQNLQTSSWEWVDWFLCRWLIKTHSRDCIQQWRIHSRLLQCVYAQNIPLTISRAHACISPINESFRMKSIILPKCLQFT